MASYLNDFSCFTFTVMVLLLIIIIVWNNLKGDVFYGKQRVYILDKINSLVYCGIEFKDFIKGIGGERCYLILAGSPDICDFNYRYF